MHIFMKCKITIQNQKDEAVNLKNSIYAIMEKIGDYNSSNEEAVWIVVESIVQDTILLYVRFQNISNQSVDEIRRKIIEDIKEIIDIDARMSEDGNSTKYKINFELENKSASECSKELNSVIGKKDILFAPRIVYQFVACVIE